MLLIIVPAICKERGSPFGASDVCTTYGLAYASLSMAVSLLLLSVPAEIICYYSFTLLATFRIHILKYILLAHLCPFSSPGHKSTTLLYFVMYLLVYMCRS